MQRLTLAAARSQLPSACFPPGQAATATLAAPYVNAAARELLSFGKWAGTVGKYAFTIYDNQLTLPRFLQTVLGAAIRGTGDRSKVWSSYLVANQWYQFISGGPGLLVNPPYDTAGFEDYRDTLVVFRDLPSEGRVKIVTTATEDAALTFHVRGIYQGQPVFTGTGSSRIEGENITIPQALGGTATSTSTFDAGDTLYSIVKPATHGVILMYLVDSLAVETLIGRYDPGELLPCYRRYSTPQRTDSSDQAVVFCKRRHVDAVVDNDEVFPANLGALECALLAIFARRKSDNNRYMTYMNNAMALLNADLTEETAAQSFGVFQIDPAIGMGDVPNLV